MVLFNEAFFHWVLLQSCGSHIQVHAMLCIEQVVRPCHVLILSPVCHFLEPIWGLVFRLGLNLEQQWSALALNRQSCDRLLIWS